jgi:hypothetical protein
MGEIAPVPLFVHVPGQQGGKVDDSHRCTTDIVPMIARVLGIKVPWETYKCSDTVTIAQYNGNPTSLALSAVLKQRSTALRRRLAVFPAGGGVATLYRFGPNPQLIGKSATSLPKASSSGASVTLLSKDYTYQPGGRIPVLVQGTLRGVKPGDALAVALNGRIVTTGEAFPLLGATRVAATLPEEDVKQGQNDVQVYRVTGSGGKLSLEPLGGSS